jgi:tetratricopeptide (TPR) repeat protein
VGAPVLPVGPLDVVTRARLLRVAVDLGDQFLALGRVADALRQYQLAFALAPADPLVQARLNLVAGNVPGVVGIDPLSLLPLVTQPRVVVFDFVTPAGTNTVPPWLGWAMADNLAPYVASSFEVIDRRLAYWYMARLGLTLRDVAVDPSARFWLGRALNVRYFVFGALTPATTGFDVATRMVDAELNFQVGSAAIHVRDPLELQWRLPELVQLMLMNPLDRVRYEQGMQQVRQLLAQGDQFFAMKNFPQARNFYQLALNAQPGNVEAMVRIQRTYDAEWTAARGLPAAQRMTFAQAMLDREQRRDEIFRDAGRQFALDLNQRRGRDDAFRSARQAMDQKAADRITAFVSGQLDGKSLTPQLRQQALDLLLTAGRLQRNKTVDNLVARVAPKVPTQSQPSTPIPVVPPNQRPDDFNAWMAKGNDARLAKRFGEAAALYGKALELSPGDPRATKARDFSRLMQDGVSLLRKGKHKQAADAFRGARDMVGRGPDYQLADQSRRKAEYDHNMAEGRKAMQARRFDDAVPFFREATRLFANDPEAAQLLQQAQQQSKKAKGKTP